MTIHELRCDVCGRLLFGWEVHLPESPLRGVRLDIHPGVPLMHDESVLVCAEPCWAEVRATLGPDDLEDICAICGEAVPYEGSLHVSVLRQKFGARPTWQFCRAHGAEFMNRFRFVDPKMGADDLKLGSDFPKQ